jgi:hypothetical protein
LAAPKVIAPYDGEPVYREDNSRLVWQWIRNLEGKETFAVRIWQDGQQKPDAPTMLTGNEEQRFGLDQTGKYFWNVTVVKQVSGALVQVSESSEARSFGWMGLRPSQATSTPAAPTNTPVSPTKTSAPPTATLVPPTNTPVPPTNTPVPPTDTPVPPTDTPAPPTDTPPPPSPTPLP